MLALAKTRNQLDDSGLGEDISPRNVLPLTFPDPRHRFIALEGAIGRYGMSQTPDRDARGVSQHDGLVQWAPHTRESGIAQRPACPRGPRGRLCPSGTGESAAARAPERRRGPAAREGSRGAEEGQRGRVASAASLPHGGVKQGGLRARQVRLALPGASYAHRPPRGPAHVEAAARKGHQSAAGSVPPSTTPARGVPASS